MSIEQKISHFILELRKEYDLFKYIYNTKPKDVDLSKNPVYYSGPYWDEKEIIAIFKAVLTGKWLSSGEYVHKFEHAFSKKFNVGHSLMVNSGSSANLVMISALKKYFNWRDSDEIIVSVVGFPTTVAPIVQNNLSPIFIDIEFNSLNFNLSLIEGKITPKTKAIFVSPVLGNPPDMDIIIDICNKYGLKLILDNCDSLGSKWKGKYLNEYAVASSCSFYPSHHITTAEGGMVSSNDNKIIDIARSFSWWGRNCYCTGSANLLPCGTCGNRFDKWLDKYDGVIDHKYVFTNIGYNLKPLDLQGAIGLVQLSKFDEIHKKRIEAKRIIQQILTKYLSFIHIPANLEYAETCWFGVPIICQNNEQKIKLVAYFEHNKIQTRPYFAGNILLHEGYCNLDFNWKYPRADEVLHRVFFIGCAPSYNDDVFNYIEKVVKNFS